MDHKVEIREIEPIRAAYMEYRGDAAKANRMFPKVFQSVRGKTNGSPFFSYLSMDPETKMGNMEPGDFPQRTGHDHKRKPG